ncbi:MAG: hypothetical protein ACFCUM_04700 [Bacteroidales bacterium]|jgi:hypothetical protein
MIETTQLSLQEIIQDFNQEIDRNPKLADAYCSRGMLKLCVNDIAGAFMDLTTAIDLGCKDAFILVKYFSYL